MPRKKSKKSKNSSINADDGDDEINNDFTFQQMNPFNNNDDHSLHTNYINPQNINDNVNYNNDGDDHDDSDDKMNDDDSQRDSKINVLFPQKSLLSQIKNKIRRRELYIKYKEQKKKEKIEIRKQRINLAKSLGDDAPPKQIPRTIESTRESDETMVEADDEEVQMDESHDEMAPYFRRDLEPKVLITSSDNPHTKTIRFCRELKQTVPNAEFRWRNRSSVKKMVKAAIERNYTDIVIVNEDWRKPNGMLLIHLPHGPTAHFKLSSVRFCKDIKHRAKYSAHRPEVILNNFNTRLGHTIGRMFASLFHYDPQFNGRRVVTFHNQRDYIFIRHHRYEFKNSERVAIHEIGPRFTLKLRSLQRGTFDSKFGEYEWALKRHEMETSRRRFFV